MSRPEERFPRRHAFMPPDPEITVRKAAPESLRVTLLDAAKAAGVSGSKIYQMIAGLMGKKQFMADWSNVWYNTQQLIEEADWQLVYELVEDIAAYLRETNFEKADIFAGSINAHFRERGIGWQFIDGKIETRGAEAFEATVRGAEKKLAETGFETASREIREALYDLSRRPEPDLSGALTHAMAALGAVARHITGQPSLTLGDIVDRYPELFPKPLDGAVAKAWGFTSQQGRHPNEGQRLDRADVEFVVGLAATVATYLAAKISAANTT